MTTDQEIQSVIARALDGVEPLEEEPIRNRFKKSAGCWIWIISNKRKRK